MQSDYFADVTFMATTEVERRARESISRLPLLRHLIAARAQERCCLWIDQLETSSETIGIPRPDWRCGARRRFMEGDGRRA